MEFKSFVPMTCEKVKELCNKTIEDIYQQRVNITAAHAQQSLDFINFWRKMTFRKHLTLDEVPVERLQKVYERWFGYSYYSEQGWWDERVAKRLLRSLDKSADGTMLVSVEDLGSIQ